MAYNKAAPADAPKARATERQRWHGRNEDMTNDVETVYETLHRIYQKHRRKYRENGDSKQVCCMWSTDDPPDIIEGTPPFGDIEDAFSITVDDDAALELYDMHLDEAAVRILEIQRLQAGGKDADAGVQ